MTTTIRKNDAERFIYRERVRLNAPHDSRNGQPGVVVRILENPSGQLERQWYDIRFDDGTYGRFVQRYLGRE